ncbi:hypothetical protein [Luteolibacter sp. LG18]|uniref:hypothetical protein n=1 Tax=Luteolibacter sp. LG18 TaxID=2819286 RepID=UPI002B3155A2|nr:hypothetical protein llg_18400 [Luteolibacter sp. LG18]
MSQLATNQYANPAPDYFWCWSGDGAAAEWRGRGKTLALWSELHPLLHHLAANGGLPPLGALMLLIAACRDEWPEPEPQLRDWIRRVGGNANPAGEQVLTALVAGLMAVRRLPADLRVSQQAKGLLAAHVFEDPACRMDWEQSLTVIGQLVSGPQVLGHEESAQDGRRQFLQDSKALLTGLAKLNKDSLESLLRTGLEQPELFRPLLVEAAPALQENRPLLDELAAAGGEEGLAAAVAKRAIAMVNFPGRFGIPNELPVGGISDITNRGTVDRLLPGELAWDDLVLAARLVHNEALYFRREDPPQDTPLRHTVLLDRGLRLWGRRRVLSLGVALGLAHHPALLREGGGIEVFGTTASDVEPLDLQSKAGVGQALRALVPSPGPEAALGKWRDSVAAATGAEDLVFITAREHLESPRCTAILGEIAMLLESRAGACRVIVMDREDGLEIQSWSSGGNRVMFRGTLEEQQMCSLEVTPPGPAKRVSSHTRAWPKLRPQSPFLFPVCPRPTAFLFDPISGGSLGFSRDGRLMRWPQENWGAHLIAEVPGGRKQWIAEAEGHIWVITSAKVPGGKPQAYKLDGNYLRRMNHDAPSHAFPQFATVLGNVVFFCYSDLIEAMSLESGVRIAELRGTNLPNRPRLAFNDGRIVVLGSDHKPDSVIESREDPFIEGMQPAPISISVVRGILRLKCEKTIRTFDPEDFSWKVETGVAAGPLTPFRPVSSNPEDGLTAATQTLVARYDPRGILRLQKPGQGVRWEIMLNHGKTSVLYSPRGLFSFDPRLVLPAHGTPPASIRRKLVGFLKAISSFP